MLEGFHMYVCMDHGSSLIWARLQIFQAQYASFKLVNLFPSPSLFFLSLLNFEYHCSKDALYIAILCCCDLQASEKPRSCDWCVFDHGRLGLKFGYHSMVGLGSVDSVLYSSVDNKLFGEEKWSWKESIFFKCGACGGNQVEKHQIKLFTSYS